VGLEWKSKTADRTGWRQLEEAYLCSKMDRNTLRIMMPMMMTMMMMMMITCSNDNNIC